MHLTTPRIVSLALALALPGLASANPLSPLRCDFDGDGFDDLAMAVTGESVGSLAGAGAVNVIYGGPNGLAAYNDQILHQNAPGVEGVAETDDAFGGALACGDFDADGYDDLAVGAPQEDLGSIANAGAVHILYGSPFGIWATDDEVLTQNTTGVQGVAASGDRFGSALAVGDLDHDGYDDLVVGVPGEDVSGQGNAGAFHVFLGAYGGITTSGNQYFTEDTRNVEGTAESGDLLGSSIVCGDFDHDGFDDVAVGSPGEDLSGPDPDNPGTNTNLSTVGAVHVLYGAGNGLTTVGDTFWSQGTSGVIGTSEEYERFGASLASGDFDRDGYDDLAIGVPGESVGTLLNAGAVNVLYGGANGISASGDQIWYQGLVQGGAESRDRFGEAVVAGDFDGDGYDDLAVGTPGESVGSKRGAGAIHVILGSAAGLDDAGNQLYYQDRQGVLYDSEAGDRFGETLSTGDYDGDGRDDLAIGVPGESVGSTVAEGIEHVMYGASYGLTSAGDQVWHQGSANIEGAKEAYEHIGSAPMSTGVYRVAFEDGTTVVVSNDYWTHRPFGRIDMHGTGGRSYTIVAAASGTIMAIVDSNAEPTNDNNYVWIAHPNGEWTKYTHMATGTVTALGWQVGDPIDAGDPIGIEGDVGKASGPHLHFEVSVPNDLANPIDSAGYIRGDNREPNICNIPGATFIGGATYTAGPCN